MSLAAAKSFVAENRLTVILGAVGLLFIIPTSMAINEYLAAKAAIDEVENAAQAAGDASASNTATPGYGTYVAQCLFLTFTLLIFVGAVAHGIMLQRGMSFGEIAAKITKAK